MYEIWQKIYKVRWSKNKNNLFLKNLSELCAHVVWVSCGCRTPIQQVSKYIKKYSFDNTCMTFLTIVWLFRHVSYVCYTSVRYQHMLDTAARLHLKVSVLHRFLSKISKFPIKTLLFLMWILKTYREFKI